MPFHLLFPLFSSVVFVIGMMFSKTAISRGASPWTGTFLANFWLAVCWGIFALSSATFLPVAGWWQAGLVALSFVLGQVLTYLAFQHGDISVATPIFGIKVILVAAMLSLLAEESIPAQVWVGAVLAAAGVAFVQSGTRSVKADSISRPKTALSVVLAIGAALCMSLFDVGLQTWGRRWGSLHFLATMFVGTGLLSCSFLPWVDHTSRLRRIKVTRLIVAGTMLMAVQALSMSWSLIAFGDATRINIVYASRGLWAVLLAWSLARIFGGNEAAHSTRVMLLRLFGAVLLTLSVVVALI